jgi:tRNA (guanosine-2'-O-)-methyltransferase
VTQAKPDAAMADLDLPVEPDVLENAGRASEEPVPHTERMARLTKACSMRMSGLRLVLDGLSGQTLFQHAHADARATHRISVADPGNRAAIIRSCEALGLLHVHVLPCTQPAPSSRRAITTGSEKWMKIHNHKDVGECIAELRGEGFAQILTAKPEHPQNDVCRRPVPLQQINFAKKTALVFGNEVSGISSLMSQLSDGDFHIPMLGLTESFNVSVAAAICVHWGRSARDQALGGSGTDLEAHECDALLAQYVHVNNTSRQFIKEMRAQCSKEHAKIATKDERRRRWQEANRKDNDM